MNKQINNSGNELIWRLLILSLLIYEMKICTFDHFLNQGSLILLLYTAQSFLKLYVRAFRKNAAQFSTTHTLNYYWNCVILILIYEREYIRITNCIRRICSKNTNVPQIDAHRRSNETIFFFISRSNLDSIFFFYLFFFIPFEDDCMYSL